MHPSRIRWFRILGGAFAANLLGWAVTVLYAWIFRRTMTEAPKVHEIAAISLYANLLLVPMAMGVIAAYFWQRLEMRIWGYLLCALLTVAMCVGGAYLLVKEGAVCLLIASPLLWGALFAGSLIGRLIFRKVEGRLQLAIFPVIILAIFAEGKMVGDEGGVVTDQIVVAAPPAEVWKHVVAFPRITDEPDYWLNKVGLPSAAETTCEGEFVGAKRECIFSNGLVFKEVVSELEPQRRLTFDVTEQPNDPELLGHVTLHRGQFELQANPDGSTMLIGRSWYTLRVRPLWYFDWWTRDITREVHLRVMRHIKHLSEARG
ncbi:MAG: SRPBCC family protein [Chthoniobacterales bacterium]